MISAIHRFWGITARIATLAALALHFTLTLIFVFPLNPVKMELGRVAAATIGSFFPQNWSLFAPTPVTETQSLLVRCLRHEEVPLSPTDKLPPLNWDDVSSTHFAQAQQHRLSSYERLVRPLQNSLRQYLTGGPDLYPLHKACQKGDKEACQTLETSMKPRRQQALRMLRRIGSAFCRETRPAKSIEGVAIRFREASAVPWSARAAGKPKVTDYELGVFPIERDVSLPGLYLPENDR